MAQASPVNYMKLSGAFSEILPLSSEDDVDINGLASQIQPWTDVVFDAFGPDRVMFGSDWPVANIGGGGNDVAWNRWIRVVETILDRRGLTEKEKEGVWGQVAVKAYGIQL
jgi:L-rhamnono-1,4-lactonase